MITLGAVEVPGLDQLVAVLGAVEVAAVDQLVAACSAPSRCPPSTGC